MSLYPHPLSLLSSTWGLYEVGQKFGGAANEGPSKDENNSEILLVRYGVNSDKWYSVIVATKDIACGAEVLLWYGNGTGWSPKNSDTTRSACLSFLDVVRDSLFRSQAVWWSQTRRSSTSTSSLS
jgi:hypothetical protein